VGDCLLNFGPLFSARSGSGRRLKIFRYQTQPLEPAETARIAAEKAASLTTQLLSFGRRQVLVLQVLDVNELLKELKEMLSTLPTEQAQLTMTLVSSHCRSRSTPERLSKS